jgi:hypothetical protein
MKRILVIALLSGFVFSMSGCAVFEQHFATPSIVPKSEYKALATKYAHRAEIISSVETNNPSDTELKIRRDRALAELLELSEYNYDTFRTGLYVHDGIFNSSLDLTSIALSTTATVVGGGTGQILSAADTAVKASQGKVSERWLASKTISVLINQMDSDRAKIKGEIGTGMHQAKYADFTMESGFELVQELDSAGSLISALNGLQTQTGAQKATNETIANLALHPTAVKNGN